MGPSTKYRHILIEPGSPFGYKQGKTVVVQRITFLTAGAAVTLTTPDYTTTSSTPVTLHGPFVFEPGANGDFSVDAGAVTFGDVEVKD